MPKKIIILSDDIPGHFNQSKGIATLLSTQINASVSIETMVYKFTFLRSIITFLARILCRLMSELSANIIRHFYQNIDMNGVDLIIAAGGNTAPLSAALKKTFSVPVIQLGSPRGIPLRLFNALVTVEKYFDHPANIVVDITPNIYSPSDCLKAAKSQDMHHHLLFLIGGKGIGYSYEQEEWTALVKNIFYLQKDSQLPVTIVTSRRTDPIVEKKLQHELSSISSSYSAWYHKGDKNYNLAALFGSAKNIFVTEDSAMMISESISSGKPVTTLYPSKINSPLRYENHISKYADLELVKRSPLYDFEIRSKQDLNERIIDHRHELAKKLMRAIGW